MPFLAKRKVVEAAFNSAIIYGCESWLNTSSNVMRGLYTGAIKCLLGVRVSTADDLCLAELGLPSLDELVKHRQRVFFAQVYAERQGMEDDPLMFALEMTRHSNPSMYTTRISNEQ